MEVSGLANHVYSASLLELAHAVSELALVTDKVTSEEGRFKKEFLNNIVKDSNGK